MVTKKAAKKTVKAPVKKPVKKVVKKAVAKEPELIPVEEPPLIEIPPELPAEEPDEVVVDEPDQVAEEPEEITEIPPELPEIPIEELTMAAWNTVKGPDDADFDHCEPNFQAVLRQHARDVQETKQVLPGDTQLARFEQELSLLMWR
jgi:hypothetical protein